MSVASSGPAAAPPRFDGLRALFINCTLKRSPEPSNTDGYRVQQRHHGGARCRRRGVRAVDHDIATGVWPDMTEHGWETDDWPAIYEQVMAADILVLAGPIWLGDNSSVTKRVIERLYACSGMLNDAGQYAYYGRVGGCLITGNEDGIKHCAMNVLYSLQHLGYTIPPQADAGWIGEAGPGPVVPRPGLGRPGERLHQPQHRVHDLEPDAPGAACCERPAASRRTATSAPSGTPAALPTTPTPSTGRHQPGKAHHDDGHQLEDRVAAPAGRGLDRHPRHPAHVDPDRRQDPAGARAAGQPLVAGHALRHPARADDSDDPDRGGPFDIEFDFVDHQLRIRSSDGERAPASRWSRSPSPSSTPRPWTRSTSSASTSTIDARPERGRAGDPVRRGPPARLLRPRARAALLAPARAGRPGAGRVPLPLRRQGQPGALLLGRDGPGRAPASPAARARRTPAARPTAATG